VPSLEGSLQGVGNTFLAVVSAILWRVGPHRSVSVRREPHEALRSRIGPAVQRIGATPSTMRRSALTPSHCHPLRGKPSRRVYINNLQIINVFLHGLDNVPTSHRRALLRVTHPAMK
jgi:hypothetical protein